MDQPYSFFTFEKDLDISHLVSLFYYKSLSDFKYDGESHSFWEFIYIDKGKMIITAGDKEYILKAGELAFHKPGEFHAVRAYEETSSCFIVAEFVCDAMCMSYFEHRILHLTNKERAYLHEAVRLWKDCVVIEQTPYTISPVSVRTENQKFALPQMVQHNLELLLITLVQRGKSIKIQRRADSYYMQTQYLQLTENVLVYLNTHLTQQLTLEQISADLGYSVPQIKKLFSRQMRQGVIEYFIGLKMNEAKRLIQEGHMNITQISTHLGYTDVSYFSRVFKARHHMTPSEYGRTSETKTSQKNF